MKNRLSKCMAFLVFTLMTTSQVATAQTPEITFNKDGKFKIVQFTDLHIRHNDKRSETAFEVMNEVIKSEKPDLIVFTGDLIYSQPAADVMKSIVNVPTAHKTPFLVTFGNHDREQGLSNAELLQIVNESPYSLTSSEVEVSGTGNTCLPIKSSDKTKDAFVIYAFDSHRSSALDTKGYDYIKFDQIDWYRQLSSAFKATNNGEVVPSLFFFHIPIPEYNQAATDENASLYGIRREKACAPVVNSGLFTAAKEGGDVLGMFVGHDHDNDYAVNWKGILLAYGRFTGGPTEYIHIPNGARVIELTEGKNEITTWIREKGNKTMQHTTFPADYTK